MENLVCKINSVFQFGYNSIFVLILIQFPGEKKMVDYHIDRSNLMGRVCAKQSCECTHLIVTSNQHLVAVPD